MSSLPSTSKGMSSSGSSDQKPPSFGSSTELFNDPDCAAMIVVMDYYDDGKTKFLRSGGFAVNQISQTSSQLTMTTCTVDCLQWPISKDAPIIRVGPRSFAFGMPGLLYGLQFPSSCDDQKIQTLERLFMNFGHYQDVNVRKLNGYLLKDDDFELWGNLRFMIETIVHNTLSQFGHHPGKSPFAVGLDGEYSCSARILRTSATTKMVGNAILSGFLQPNLIEIEDMRPKQKSGGDSSGSSSSEVIPEQAFASISVFTNLVEAVEVYWVLASGKSHLLGEKYTNLTQLVGFKMWRLKQAGITAFLKKLSSEGLK